MNLNYKQIILNIILIIITALFFSGFFLTTITPDIPDIFTPFLYGVNIISCILFITYSFLWKKNIRAIRPLVYIYIFGVCIITAISLIMVADSFILDKGDAMNNQQGYIIYHKKYNLTLYGIEKLHPFDSCKYKKIMTALKTDMVIQSPDIITPTPVSNKTLLALHTNSYLKKCNIPAEIAKIVELAPVALFPSPVVKKKIIYPQRLATGGTIMAGEIALRNGLCINLSGGYHHAHKDTGSGFCFFADVPLSIYNLLEKKAITKALIIDTDVHHGDGNAEIFQDSQAVDILDVYETYNFPSTKYPVTYNCNLPSGIDGEYYLTELKKCLTRLDPYKYDIIYYNAGTDVLESDSLGNLLLSIDDVVKREMMIAEFAHSNNIPLVIVLSGGYSKESWKAHSESLKEIILLFKARRK